MNNKYGFMVCVDKKYHEYVPAFVYFLNKSYPDAVPIIVSPDSLCEEYQQYIFSISPNTIVVRFNPIHSKKMNSDQIKCLRWIIQIPELMCFDYIYIGDADMAIMQENPSLMDQHIAHCNETGLPYSNFQRQAAPTNRLSGVHIIKTKEWFKAISQILGQYRHRVFREFDTLDYSDIGFNEQLLYDLVCESKLGIPSSFLSHTYNRHIISSHHHGIHIRLFEHQGLNGILNVKGNKGFKEQFCNDVTCNDFKKLYEVSHRVAGTLNRLRICWEQNK